MCDSSCCDFNERFEGRTLTVTLVLKEVKMNGENYLIILVWQALSRIAFIKLVTSGE